MLLGAQREQTNRQTDREAADERDSKRGRVQNRM